MHLLKYRRHWINALGTYDFFDGIRQSWFYTVPPHDRQTYDAMKQRMKTPPDHRKLHISSVPVQNLQRGMVVEMPDGRVVDDDGMVTLVVPKSHHKAQPAQTLEGYLAFSGGSYAKTGHRGGKGGVSRQGYERNLTTARVLMYEKRPRLTSWDYRKVLAECKPTDVVYLDVPYKDADVKVYDDRSMDFPGLIQTLLNAPYRWMLSEYPNKIYDPLTKKFGKPKKFRVQRTMGNIHQTGKKKVTECVWRNFTT